MTNQIVPRTSHGTTKLSNTNSPSSSSIRPSFDFNSTEMTVGKDGVQEFVRYVEVPIYEEVLTPVPVKETVEVEKRSVKYETEWVDKYVEVPEIRYVEKIVEVPTVQEVIKTVTRKQVVAVPTEIIKYVTRLETKVVEVEKRIPGERIEVPVYIDVVKDVIVPRYIDSEVPTVVAQTIVPIVTDEGDEESVDVITYEPFLIPVDIYIAKPFFRPLICEGKMCENLKEVEVPAPQYNSMLKELNSEIISVSEVYRDMPFRAESDASIHFLGSRSGEMSGKPGVLTKSMSAGIPLRHLAVKKGEGNQQGHAWTSLTEGHSRSTSENRGRHANTSVAGSGTTLSISTGGTFKHSTSFDPMPYPSPPKLGVQSLSGTSSFTRHTVDIGSNSTNFQGLESKHGSSSFQNRRIPYDSNARSASGIVRPYTDPISFTQKQDQQIQHQKSGGKKTDGSGQRHGATESFTSQHSQTRAQSKTITTGSSSSTQTLLQQQSSASMSRSRAATSATTNHSNVAASVSDISKSESHPRSKPCVRHNSTTPGKRAAGINKGERSPQQAI